ncbi:MAG: sulfatase-like hydrolase/transferase [Bacteroidales bacterium]|nr:sulfatase-like hydrolase/transferase [Bacteroidales bacterium]
MKQILGSFFRQLLFWILFFNFTRVIFLLYHLRLIRIEKIPFQEVLAVFYHAFKLDLATACYFMILPFLLLAVQTIYSPRWLNIVNKAYAGIMIFFYSLTAAGEMGIYSEWKTKLTYKVINYLRCPSEIYNSAGTSDFLILLLLLLVMSGTGIYLYIRWFYPNLVRVKRVWWFTVGFLLLVPGPLFLGMRGGVQEIPINQSESIFTRKNILNVASVNNLFNLYISVFENLRNFDRNPYVFMDHSSAKSLVQELYKVKKDTTIQILTTNRPNVVLLILESWSADLIEDLGGKSGITPEVRKLQEGGILFTEIYASGSRSEQGMASIFGGLPAHPISCITVQPDKYQKVPSLSRNLSEKGYTTAFYFGGQLIYGNIKGYIYYNGFQKIMEIYDFPDELPLGKLGIHDEFTLGYMADDLDRTRQPFFVALFTLSTHSPWDQPFEKPLTWGDNEREYINAAFYTDHCLGEFFQQAARKPWFDSTLFIIVADHSHNSYYNWHPHSREYHKIPMLFYGNVIREEFRGTTWSSIGNQHDIPATLLAQLDLPANQFHWSKNLFNPYVADFAYFSNEDGAGWIRPDGYFSFDLNIPYFYFYEPSPQRQDTMIQEGKAYLQEVFREYLED